MVHAFVRKLRHGAHLDETAEKVLTRLAQPVHTVVARGDILVEGTRPLSLPLIIDGWTCRYRLLENGRRQIISLFLPGDLCEPFGVLPRFLHHALGALTPAVLARVSLDAIGNAARGSPCIKEALWWDLLVASGIEREHVVSLGRRSASERMGHLFRELHLRLSMVDLVEETGFDLPITQTDLGDLLGLSTVHVNRSLQELRKSGLISLRGHRLTINDLNGLSEHSFFDPTYLHSGLYSGGTAPI